MNPFYRQTIVFVNLNKPQSSKSWCSFIGWICRLCSDSTWSPVFWKLEFTAMHSQLIWSHQWSQRTCANAHHLNSCTSIRHACSLPSTTSVALSATSFYSETPDNQKGWYSISPTHSMPKQRALVTKDFVLQQQKPNTRNPGKATSKHAC